MSRPRPPSFDCIHDIMKRLDLLAKLGVKDLPINAEEASAVTGLAKNTLCRYATMGHFPVYKYPNRNLYPLREMCEWVLEHYHGVKVKKTSDMNNYKVVKRQKPTRKGEIA
ncbi:hypothetical protein [Treponema sp. R6D11]